MTAIEVTALRKSFGAAWRAGGQLVLSDLSLTVERGVSFGLIGPNGAGKTTLVKTLLGIVRPNRGRVRVLGGSPEDPATRARIGYLPERMHFAPGATGFSFLASVARLRRLGSPGPEIKHQLSRVGLLPDAHKKVSTFSKGMRQRLGVAGVILGQPDLLVLDEPTDGIDPLGRAEVRKILGEERDRGATVFLNSHLLAETERSCDRIGLLVGGRIVREGPLHALCRDESRWRLRFAAPHPRGDMLGLGLTPGSGPEIWELATTDIDALNATIQAAQATGARLVELSPHVRDLEEILAEVVTEDAS